MQTNRKIPNYAENLLSTETYENKQILEQNNLMFAPGGTFAIAKPQFKNVRFLSLYLYPKLPYTQKMLPGLA